MLLWLALAGLVSSSTLNGFDIYSQNSGTLVNLNIFPIVNFLNTTHVQIVFQTMFYSVKLDFYSMAVVFWVNPTINTNGYSLFTFIIKDSSTTVSNLIYTTSSSDIYSYNVFTGLKSFQIN